MKANRIITLGLACGLAAFAAAQTTGKAAITAIYAKMDAVVLKRDAGGLKKLMAATMTKDCTIVDVDGSKTPGDQMIGVLLEQLQAMTKITKSTTHVDSYSEKAGTAKVITTAVLAFNAPDKDGKSHAFVVSTKGEDTWVKSGAAWKLKVSKNNKQAITQDGKPYVPPKQS